MFLEKPIGVYKSDDALKIICDFIDYSTFHFYYEESYFEINKNYNWTSHLLEHEEFKKQITYINPSNFSNQNYNELKMLLNFLYNWIFNHISIKDLELKKIIYS